MDYLRADFHIFLTQKSTKYVPPFYACGSESDKGEELFLPLDDLVVRLQNPTWYNSKNNTYLQGATYHIQLMQPMEFSPTHKSSWKHVLNVNYGLLKAAEEGARESARAKRDHPKMTSKYRA